MPGLNDLLAQYASLKGQDVMGRYAASTGMQLPADWMQRPGAANKIRELDPRGFANWANSLGLTMPDGRARVFRNSPYRQVTRPAHAQGLASLLPQGMAPQPPGMVPAGTAPAFTGTAMRPTGPTELMSSYGPSSFAMPNQPASNVPTLTPSLWWR